MARNANLIKSDKMAISRIKNGGILRLNQEKQHFSIQKINNFKAL